MFKVGKWRNEKIKVVFKLQFQVTQVPCSRSRLMISLVPVDVGQPTVRLGKVAVQDGIYKWENPVYEAVKFRRETKTGKLQDKIYHFIISTGSSKSGFLGEVSVNLADYVEATTPSTISLPIKSSSPGAILHVTIQNMEGVDDQRDDFEENRTLAEETQENSLQSHQINSQLDGVANYNTNEDEKYNTMVSPDERRRNFRSSNTLSSILKQKDNRTHQESCSNQLRDQKNSVPKALPAHLEPVPKEHQAREPSTMDSSSEEDVFNFMENTEENFPREQEQEPPKSLVEQLKREIFTLKRQAEVTDIELQSLRRQVVKETKRGHELSRQVFRLKEEREALRKGENGNEYVKEMGTERKKPSDHMNEVEEDLIQAKDLNKVLRSQLRKTQDSNSELILVVKDLEEKLDKKDRELANLSSKFKSERKSEELYAKDSEDELVNNKQLQEEVNSLEQLTKDLQCELEEHVKEKREFEKQIEQLSLDYEISKKENNDLSSKFNQKQLDLIKKEKEYAYNTRKVEELESQIARLEKVIENQAEEFSESSDIINDLETRINSLKYELERQAEEFEDELKAITDAKFEQVQRALQAEENLRKTKLDNTAAAQRLQEEFQKLSEELESKFNENEELTIKAETEARELRFQITILEEHLEKVNKELELVQDRCSTQVRKLSSEMKEKEREIEELLLAHEDEIAELRSSNTKTEDKCEAFSNENQALRIEVERLTEENYYFIKQLEEMKTMVDETKNARDDLETKYTSAWKEIERSQEELKSLRYLKETEGEMSGVQSELEKLRAQHDELKNRLSELQLENDKLRKQVSRQKENLQKKDHDIGLLEKFKNNSTKETSALKEKVKQLKAIRPAGTSPDNSSKVEERKYMAKKFQHSEASDKSLQNGANRKAAESRRETCPEKKVPDSRTSDLLTEVTLLKEKNKLMEDELKEMQDKYSEVSLKFAEVEGERQQLVMTIRNLRNGHRK